MTAKTYVRARTITLDILDDGKAVVQAGIDIDPVVESLTLERPQYDTQAPNGYHDFTGTLTLKAGNNLGYTTSTNPRDTAASPSGASIFAVGNRVTITMADTGGVLQPAATLFITEVPDPNNLPSPTVVIQLGDESKLIDHDDTPEGDESDVVRGTARSASAIANSILSSQGLPTSSDIVSNYSISVEPQKNDTRSWPKYIGELMGTRGHYFWFDATGTPRYTPIEFGQSAPALSLTIGGDNGDESEGGWLLVKESLYPPRTLTVLGQGGTAEEIENPKTTDYDRPGDGFTALDGTLTQEWSFGTTPTFTETRTERQAERLIRPEDTTVVDGVVTDSQPNTTSSLRNSLDYELVVTFSTITQKERDRVTTEKVARGLAGGDAWRGTDGNSAALSLITTTTTVTTEYDRITGLMERRVTSVNGPWCLVPWTGDRPVNYELNRFLVREVERVTETWDQTRNGWIYEKETLRPRGVVERNYQGLNADILITDPADSATIEGTDTDARPPRPNYVIQRYTSSRQQYSGKAQFTPLAGAAYKNKEDTIRVQGPYVVSDGQCSFLAELLGKYRHGRALGARFVGAVPDWLFSGYVPGARVDVAVDGVITAYLLDGWTLQSDIRGTFWGCSLVQVGVVGVAPDAVTSPVAVTFPVSLSIPIPMPGANFTAAVSETAAMAIPIPMPGVNINVGVIVNASMAIPIPMPGVDIAAGVLVDASMSIPVPMPGVDINAGGPIDVTVNIPVPMPGVDINVGAVGDTSFNIPVPMPGVDIVADEEGAWSPLDISTVIWLDGVDSSTILVDATNPANDGELVQTWLDKSGNNNHASQSNGSFKAVYDSANDALNFSGDFYVILDNATVQLGTGDYMTCYLVRVDNASKGPNDQHTIMNKWANGNAQGFEDYIYQGLIRTRNATVDRPGPSVASAVWQLISVSRISGQLSILVNGDTSTAVNHTDNGNLSNAGLDILLGYRQSGGSLLGFGPGLLSAVVLVSEASVDARQKLEGFIAHNAGLESILAASHPYKNSPP